MSRRRRASDQGAGYVAGMFVGGAMGAMLAMLMAPRPGAELRQSLSSGVDDLKQAAKDGWDDVAQRAALAVDKGKEAYRQTQHAARQVEAEVAASADNVAAAVKDVARAAESRPLAAPGVR